MSDKRRSPSELTLAVLAGGLSSRMGSAKPSLLIQGKPILAYLREQLQWPGPTLLVTAAQRKSPPGTDLFDREVVDQLDGQGPLRGILTALENSLGDILVVTVDMPGVRSSMLRALVASMKDRPELSGLMYRVMRDDMDHVEPFPSIFRRSAQQIVVQALAENRRSVRGLLSDSRFATTDAPVEWPTSVWTNLNTPQDFAAFEKSLNPQDTM